MHLYDKQDSCIDEFARCHLLTLCRFLRKVSPQPILGLGYRNQKREHRKNSERRYFDKIANDKPQLKQNQNVLFETKSNEKQIFGENIDYIT